MHREFMGESLMQNRTLENQEGPLKWIIERML
jgi:hypothetical protein